MWYLVRVKITIFTFVRAKADVNIYAYATLEIMQQHLLYFQKGKIINDLSLNDRKRAFRHFRQA